MLTVEALCMLVHTCFACSALLAGFQMSLVFASP